MGGRRRNFFVLLLVAGMIAGSAAVIASKPTRLGLDLRGGIELVYQGQPTPQQPKVTPQAVDRALEILRERIDQFGVAEPEISRLGANEISVGLPDVKDTQRAIKQVGKTAQLYLYDWEPNVIGKPGAQNPTEQPFTNLFDAVKLASKQKPECRNCTTGDRYYLFGGRTHGLIDGPEDIRKDLFANQPGERQPAGSVIFKVPQGTVVIENEPATNPSTGQQIPNAPPTYWVLHDRPSLSGTDITNPKQEFDPNTNQPNVTFGFTGSGRQKFQDVTRRIAQRGLQNALPGSNPEQTSGHFAIVLDNQLQSRPIINYQENPDGIDGRTGAQISGSFTITDAQDLAKTLQIGALPINLKLISQNTVSATLGKQALDQGLRAGIAGLLVVILFLLLFYRFLGLVASIALVVYAVIFYALIILIPITLTLPGIAGLILTIGVAADSNIVIFERIKEEARAGRSIPSAIAAGYSRGIRTIIDANVVTLITAFILFVLATAGVKGFAFTLAIGTIVSLLTAVVFTQAVLGSLSRARFMRSPAMLGASKERVRWHFDFMGASRWFFSMSGAILIVGAISLATLQLNLGIDFKSGTRITVALKKAASESDLRAALERFHVRNPEIQRVSQPKLGQNVFQISAPHLQPGRVGHVETDLNRKDSFGVVPNSFDSTSVGPTFGKEIARSAIYAIVFSLLVICGYVALRFDPKFAVPVLIALFHDILITAGVYALTGREVTSATVAALLTILGYSLYDTIIVFDRIRENVPRMPRAAFAQIVNKSMSEVLTRSLVTSLSTLMPVMALLLFGGATLKDFAFALMVGIASGTYSSIFIASPVLTAWKEREPANRRRRSRILAELGHLPAFPEDNVGLRAEEDREDGEAPPEPASSKRIPRLPATGPKAQIDGPEEPEEPTPAEGAEPVGAGADRPPKAERRAQQRRRQQRRRRKHGRNR